jgi:hypothetical protein
VRPAVGHLGGPGGEQVIELIQGLDAVVGSLGQERLADIPVQPFLFPPPFGLTGQSKIILWITGMRDRVLSGVFAVRAFEAAELFFVAADAGGDGFEAAAQLVDLDGEAGQRGGVAAAGTVLFDERAQAGPPVEGGPADAGARGDLAEGDGLPGCGELGAGDLDPGQLVVLLVSWHGTGR